MTVEGKNFMRILENQTSTIKLARVFDGTSAMEKCAMIKSDQEQERQRSHTPKKEEKVLQRRR